MALLVLGSSFPGIVSTYPSHVELGSPMAGNFPGLLEVASRRWTDSRNVARKALAASAEHSRPEWLSVRSHLDQALRSAAEADAWFKDAAKDLDRDTHVATDDHDYGSVRYLVATAHDELHQSGDMYAGLFGCKIDATDDGSWWFECVVDLAHFERATSPGFTARLGCVGCGKGPAECPHEEGEQVEVVVTRTSDGLCSFCGSAACDHQLGDTVQVAAYQQIVDAQLHEVSMVIRARDPLARISGITVEPAELGLTHGTARTLKHDGCRGQCVGEYLTTVLVGDPTASPTSSP